MSQGKIVYNKEKSGKLLSRGGPRDIQLRQRIMQENLIRSRDPAPHMVTMDKSNPSAPVVDMSQYLPLNEVKKKIEEVVKVTREASKRQYESGINILNEQINEYRKKAKTFQEEIINKNTEIVKLRERLSSTVEISESVKKQINKKDLRIVELESNTQTKSEMFSNLSRDASDLTIKLENAARLLQERDAELTKLQESMSKRDDYLHDKDIEIHKKNIELVELKSRSEARGGISEELSDKLDKLYDKISDGSIKHLVGSKMGRPDLEDRIFIDPLDAEDGKDLEPHIEINEEKTQSRDVGDDVNKLRTLLKLTKGR